MKLDVKVDVVRPSTPSANDLQRKKIFWFVIANLVAVAAGAGIFWAFLVAPEGATFDAAMGAIWRFLRKHETVAVLAASLPFFASLLVGQFEMRKARARRARNEAVEKRERLEAERVAQEAERLARRAARA